MPGVTQRTPSSLNRREDRRAAAAEQRFGPSERTSPLRPSYGLHSIRFGSRGCRGPEALLGS